MYGFSKYEAQERYDTFNTVQVKLKLNQKTDADILAWIRQHKYGRETSVQGAIKALIREDIARAQAGGGAGLIPHAFDLPQAALERDRFKAHLLTFSRSEGYHVRWDFPIHLDRNPKYPYSKGRWL